MLKETFGEQEHFEGGWESVEHDNHSGRPLSCTTSKMNAQVHEVILKYFRLTIHTISCRPERLSSSTHSQSPLKRLNHLNVLA